MTNRNSPYKKYDEIIADMTRRVISFKNQVKQTEANILSLRRELIECYRELIEISGDDLGDSRRNRIKELEEATND